MSSLVGQFTSSTYVDNLLGAYAGASYARLVGPYLHSIGIDIEPDNLEKLLAASGCAAGVAAVLPEDPPGDHAFGLPQLVVETACSRERFVLRKYFRYPVETAVSILQPLVSSHLT